MRLLALLALSLPGMAAAGTGETNKKLWDGARWGDISMVRDALGAGAGIDAKEPECMSTLLPNGRW